MTEADWWTNGDVSALLRAAPPGPGRRKHLLFAVACCRRVCRLLRHTDSRLALEVADRRADELASEEEWHVAFESSRNVVLVANDASQLAYQLARGEAPPEEVDAWELSLAREGLLLANAAADAAEAVHLAAQLAGESAELVLAEWVADAARCAVGWEQGNAHNPGGEAINFEAETAEMAAQCELARDLFAPPGLVVSLDPAWLAWGRGLVPRLAEAIYWEGAFERLPILGDALEEAGCVDERVLEHCHEFGPHWRGCWVLDRLLGKQ
jgi:hypothetical protein